MDAETLSAAIGMMKAMPNNAAHSAAEAAASAQEAKDAADSASSATVAETKTYLGIT